MATNSSAIQKKIETLKKGLNNKFITAAQKEKIKAQVQKLESQAKALAPKKASKPAATSLTRLQKMVNNKKYGVYKGKGVDLKKDSDRPAKAIGKRTSKSGKTYYEYRANRIDVKQPPKRYPKLEKGGYMAKGGGVGRTVMIPTYVVKEINDSVKMGYDTIVEGMIGRKRKGVMLINDKYEVRGTYDIGLKDAIQNIIDKIKSGTFKVDAVDSKAEDDYMAKGGYMADGGETKKDIAVDKNGKAYSIGDIISLRAYYYQVMLDATGKIVLAKLDSHYFPYGKNIEAGTPEFIYILKNGTIFSNRQNQMAKGGTIEDRYTIYGTSDEGWFVVDKETKRQIHPSEFGRNSWETKQELLADLKSKQMTKGGFVAVGEKDGYWTIMSKPTTKEKAQEVIEMGVPRGEVGKVVTLKEAKEHKKIIGAEYLEKGGYMAKGGEMPNSQNLFSLMKLDSKNGNGMLIDGKVYTKKEADLKKDAYEEEMFYNANTEDDMDMEVKIFSVYELLSRKSLPKTTKAKLFSSLQDKQKEIESLTERFADDKYDWKKDYADGGMMAEGGVTAKEVVESNADMVLSQIKAVKHHAEELSSVVSRKSNIEAWVVGKIERASTDLSDITHYLEGNKDKMSMGGTVRYYAHKMDKK